MVAVKYPWSAAAAAAAAAAEKIASNNNGTAPALTLSKCSMVSRLRPSPVEDRNQTIAQSEDRYVWVQAKNRGFRQERKREN